MDSIETKYPFYQPTHTGIIIIIILEVGKGKVYEIPSLCQIRNVATESKILVDAICKNSSASLGPGMERKMAKEVWKVADKPGQKQLFSTTSPHTSVKLACGSKNKFANLRRCDNSRVSFGSQVWPSELLPYQVILILRFSHCQCPAQMVLKAGSLYPFHFKDIVSHFWPCFCVDDDVCRE